MAFQKLTMQVGAVGIENTPLTITTNLEIKSWILEDLRLNTQEITLGTDVNSMAANIFYALNLDCGVGDIFGDCLVEYNGTDTVSITFFDVTVTSAEYTVVIENGLNITPTEESVSSAWSKISQDILVRSPYFIGLGDPDSVLGNINGCNVDLYVYKGDFLLDRPTLPTYQLNTLSTSLNETIYFDLSDMIKDYLEPDYPTNGGIGTVISSANENLIIQSESVDNVAWSKTLTTVTPDAVAQPGTSYSADHISCLSTSGFHSVKQGITKTASALEYTGSVVVNAAEFSRAYIFLSNATELQGTLVHFDMSTQVFSSALEIGYTGTSYDYSDEGSGFYRIWITATSDTDTEIYLTVGNVNDSNDRVFIGDNIKGIHVRGLQLKEGLISSYVETTTTPISIPSSITSVTNDCVWVDVFPTVNYNGTDYASTPEYHRAFIGYGYFEDGVNPLLIDYSPTAAPNDYKEILNESPSIILPTGEDFEIAVDSNLIDTVQYFDSSDVSLKLDTITGSDASLSQIIYSTSPDAVITSYVVVTNLDASTSQISVTYQDECLYTPYRLTFINRNGVYERLWFFKNSEKKASYEKDEFRRNTMSAGSYNLVDHQQKNLFKKSKETLRINSGFYSEDFNDVFNQLMLSESVWINYNSRELPVNIKDSSFTFKSRFNEKLINHTLELEFAFDKVNSVR